MNCPSCHNDVEVLEKNFGALFTCPSCRAVYFVNFEGQPEFSEIKDDAQFNQENVNTPTHAETEFQSSENIKMEDVGVDFLATSDPLVNSFENPFTPIEPPYTVPEQESGFSQTAKEISDFGNSEVQISVLNYDLEIAGLDSKEELLAFKEAISDSRFGWEVTDMMKRIKNGQLHLQRLNSVQAFIIAKRIHFLNLELKWKQNVLE